MTQEQVKERTWSGGCQCGAVRYKVEGPLDEVSVCYCRMCQKATGGAFGLFVKVAYDKITWTRGERKTLRLLEHGQARILRELRHAADLGIRALDGRHRRLL